MDIFRNSSNNPLFKVDLIEETIIDTGGGFREIISQIVAELEEVGAIKILAKSPNNLSQSGENQDTFMLNDEPGAKTEYTR